MSRYVTLGLIALLVLVQGDLWFGKGGIPRLMLLESQLQDQESINATARERNERLQAEVRDLKEGLEMVEERARYDLGMLRPDEILVQITPPTKP